MKNITVLLVVAGCLFFQACGNISSDEDKARGFMEARMYRKATVILERMILENPGNAETNYRLGVCYIHLGKQELAEERFESAVSLDQNYTSRTGKEFENAGTIALKKGQTGLALKLFRKAVGQSEDLAAVIAEKLFKEGRIFLERGNTAEAGKMLESATFYGGQPYAVRTEKLRTKLREHLPGNTRAAEYVKAGMYAQAEAVLNKWIVDNPLDAEAHFNLAICYLYRGKNDFAEDRFDSALALDASLRDRVGEQYRKTGVFALGKRELKRGVALLEKAVDYDPRKKSLAARACFEAASIALDRFDSPSADGLFFKARSFDPNLGDSILNAQRAYGQKLLAMAVEKPKVQRKSLVDEAARYLTQEDIDAVLPPPRWERVFYRTYKGRGLKDADSIRTVQSGAQFTQGDKLIFTGEHFWKKTGRNWEQFRGRIEYIEVKRDNGEFLFIAAEPDFEVTIEIQRKVSSY